MGDESEKDKPEDNENEERIELIYNIIQDQFRLFLDNKNTLDKKASNVIIFLRNSDKHIFRDCRYSS